MHHHDSGACDACATVSRRHLLIAGAAVTSTLALPRQGQAATAQRPKSPVDAATALRDLQEGNRRYAANAARNTDYSRDRLARAAGQAPKAIVLGCADSRVVPELLFDQAPGEVFVVRVAGNFLNTDNIASIEYAVEYLGSPLLFVLGHSGCGAVDAAIKVMKDNLELPGQLPQLLRPIFPAVSAAEAQKPANLLEAAIESNVRGQVRQAPTMSGLIGRYVAGGEVRVVGGVYEIATGQVRMVI
jgi:carbonic anhydrase